MLLQLLLCWVGAVDEPSSDSPGESPSLHARALAMADAKRIHHVASDSDSTNAVNNPSEMVEVSLEEADETAQEPAEVQSDAPIPVAQVSR